MAQWSKETTNRQTLRHHEHLEYKRNSRPIRPREIIQKQNLLFQPTIHHSIKTKQRKRYKIRPTLTHRLKWPLDIPRPTRDQKHVPDMHHQWQPTAQQWNGTILVDARLWRQERHQKEAVVGKGESGQDAHWHAVAAEYYDADSKAREGYYWKESQG